MSLIPTDPTLLEIKAYKDFLVERRKRITSERSKRITSSSSKTRIYNAFPRFQHIHER
jgi:hypothetical protein